MRRNSSTEGEKALHHRGTESTEKKQRKTKERVKTRRQKGTRTQRKKTSSVRERTIPLPSFLVFLALWKPFGGGRVFSPKSWDSLAQGNALGPGGVNAKRF
jgi:ribosomal protein L4